MNIPGITIKDSLRGKWLTPSPEEIVRQLVIRCLEKVFEVPHFYILVEKRMPGGLRADVIVLDKRLKPAMLIECKAKHVNIGPKTVQQVAAYLERLPTIRYLWITNGMYHWFGERSRNIWKPITILPRWQDI